jgi:hypothetical protein
MMNALAEQVEYVSTQQAIPMRRVWAMPSANTFDIPPIRALVKGHLYKSKVSVDPFARNKRWATHTNDLNPETAAEFHMDAEEFLKVLAARGVEADVVLFDPPYSPGQIVECYQAIGLAVATAGRNAELYKRVRDAVDAVLRPGGVVLSFGWNSNGMGAGRGYELEEVLIVAHGGAHNDTICTVERKVVSAQVAMFPGLQDASAGRGDNRTDA